MGQVRFIEFEIIKEPWNKYQLQDNSVLKTRIVLKSVMCTTKKNETQYAVDVQSINIVHADPTLRGNANTNQVSNDKILNSIEKEDMYYDSLAQESNEYKLDDGTKIKMHNNITSVSRSSLKDQHGDPIYSILSSNQVLVNPPNLSN